MIVELVISLAIVVIICFVIWYFGSKLPAPGNTIAQVIAALIGVVWLLLNLRDLIHAAVGK